MPMPASRAVAQAVAVPSAPAAAARVRAVLRGIARGLFLLVAVMLLWQMRAETSAATNFIYFVVALAAIYLGLGSSFRTWAVYAAGFAIFAQLRGYADGLGAPVQFEYPIVMEKALFFGVIPTIWLQERLYSFARLGPLEASTIAVYLSYFVLPHAMAFALWKFDHQRFKVYAIAFMATLYLGLLTCAVLPTAPPWMAGQVGDTPHVYQVLPDIAGEVTPGTYENAYEVAGANPVAAMPSLHAAVPFLMAIALWQYSRLRWAGVAYAVAMLFSVVYLGEHYVVDGIAGWGVAGLAWVGAKAYVARGETLKKVKETRPGSIQDAPESASGGLLGAAQVTEG
jgi:membrane-associated phospholipid phosphatase